MLISRWFLLPFLLLNQQGSGKPDVDVGTTPEKPERLYGIWCKEKYPPYREDWMLKKGRKKHLTGPKIKVEKILLREQPRWPECVMTIEIYSRG